MNAQPILCAHLLRVVDAKLVELLRSLPREDWDKQTIAPRWKVRDVAAHLLDTQLRKLSMVRDHNEGDSPGRARRNATTLSPIVVPDSE